MDNNCLLEINFRIKNKLEDLASKTGLNTNDLLNKLIEKNNNYEAEIKKAIEEYKEYNKQVLDAFDIADAIEDGIYVTDNKGTIIAINKGYTDIVGVEGVVGKNIQDVWDEKGFEQDSSASFIAVEMNKSMSAVEMIINNKNNKRFVERKPRAIALMVLDEKKEVSVITKIDRTQKTVIITGRPIYNQSREIIKVLVILRDLTHLVELTEKLETVEKEKRKYFKELKYYRENKSQSESDLIGESDAITKIRKLIDSVAKSEATVLLTGETGVGKEVVAREIYKNSLRKDGPYIKINCAAIPENLLESELFGYEKGAFTGAERKEKLGLFEMADHGTLLLDEIGEMPYKLQSKLLRVLQEKEVKRIGGTKCINVDVRVIAATNQKLLEQVKKGAFREDLYYRLNVVPIEIPPLRERKEDILRLAYIFLERFNMRYEKNKSFEINEVDILESYNWPGNVRELQNSIERLVVIVEDNLIKGSDIVNILGKDKFPEELLTDVSNTTLKTALDAFEKGIIERALKKYGSTHKAAKVLGVAQPTVLRKARALGIKEW